MAFLGVSCTYRQNRTKIRAHVFRGIYSSSHQLAVSVPAGAGQLVIRHGGLDVGRYQIR